MRIIKNIMNKMSSTISVEEAKDLLKKGATLVDVRTPGEFSASHAEMAINIPLDTLQDQLKSMLNKPIIVHCQSGVRSQMAMKKLQKSGCKEVYNLGGLSKALQL